MTGMTLVVRSLPDRIGGLVTDARTGAPLARLEALRRVM
jgi:hypothetical protein